MSDEERVVIVDRDDREVGEASRRRMRREGLLHRCTAILCTDRAGRIYVQKRSDEKDLWPGMFDLFAGGVVRVGESYDESARREALEELGVPDAHLEPLLDHLYVAQGKPHAFYRVYRLVWDGPIEHRDGEIAWGDFRTAEEIRVNRDGWRFTPDGLELFDRLFPA